MSFKSGGTGVASGVAYYRLTNKKGQKLEVERPKAFDLFLLR